MMRFLITLLLLCCALFLSATEYPTHQLKNSELEITLYLPDAKTGYYRGTRFDGSGIIAQLLHRGHHYYGPLHQQHDPYLHDSISGPAEEFDIHHPPGYSQAKPGESFEKIGVEAVQKLDEQAYQFHRNYPVLKQGEWQIQKGVDWIEFNQQLRTEQGYGYHYQKRIELLPNQASFLLKHTLTNSGTRPFTTEHYNHNFTLIDNTPYGPDYRVEFGFAPHEPVTINQLALFKGDSLEVIQPLQQQALWHLLRDKPGPSFLNQAKVHNLKTGAWLSFQGDHPIHRFVFWAVARSASPEPFIHIELEPGESRHWQYQYKFGVTEPAP